jgi:hypothetical protein
MQDDDWLSDFDSAAKAIGMLCIVAGGVAFGVAIACWILGA